MRKAIPVWILAHGTRRCLDKHRNLVAAKFGPQVSSLLHEVASSTVFWNRSHWFMHWILFLVHIICFAPKNLIGGLYALRRIQRAMFFSLWTCKNHHFVVSNLCIPIEHGHIKMAQILFKSKTRHSWWPGLEVVSERASWGNFCVFGMRLLRWQLMTTDARSRSKLHLIPPRSCQKLPEAAETQHWGIEANTFAWCTWCRRGWPAEKSDVR